MKKYLLITAMGILFFGIPNVSNAEEINAEMREYYETDLMECVQAQGWTLDQVYHPKDDKYPRYKKDAIEYIEEYIDIIKCFSEREEKYQKGKAGIYLSRYTVGVRVGRDCEIPKWKQCESEFSSCTVRCADQWDVYHMDQYELCVKEECNAIEQDCLEKNRLECLEEYFNDLRKISGNLGGTADQPPPPPATGSNAFCQPPDAEPIAYNKYGIPIANAQIYSNHSVVTYIQGEVLIKTKNAPRWAPAFKGQRLTIGDKIKTGRNGSAEVKFANSAIFRMRPLSQLGIPDHKNPCNCRTNLNVGYLDMKFGNLWDRITGEPGACAHLVKTPTAIAGGGRPSQLRSYPRNTDPSIIFRLKNIFKGITPNNLKPSSYQENMNTDVVYNVLEIPIASADEGEIILHASYDEDTQVSQFYVEQGEVEVVDVNATVSVPLSAGEHISVGPDSVPHEMDIEPIDQISGQWWEDWDDSSGIPFYVSIVLYLAGIVLVFRFVRKSKRGLLVKIGIFIAGYFVINIIISFLMLLL